MEPDGDPMTGTLHSLFFSPTDGTAKLVRAVTEGFGHGAVAHDITLPLGRDTGLAFEQRDAVVIGVPVYAGRVPPTAARYLDRVRGNGACAVLVGVYGNRAFEDALLELRDLCLGRGFRCLAAGAFVAEHSYTAEVATGRPDREDLRSARTFGAEAAAKLRHHPGPAGLPALSVPGNFPYKDLAPRVAMAPGTGEDCAGCLTCAEHCPTGAISFEDPHQVDPDRCIRCCSCVKRCPLKAKSFHHPVFLERRAALAATLSRLRREPEFFL
jgi:ferredoxin